MIANKVTMKPIINLSDDRQTGKKISMIHPAKAIRLHTEKIVPGVMLIVLRVNHRGNDYRATVKLLRYWHNAVQTSAR